MIGPITATTTTTKLCISFCDIYFSREQFLRVLRTNFPSSSSLRSRLHSPYPITQGTHRPDQHPLDLLETWGTSKASCTTHHEIIDWYSNEDWAFRIEEDGTEWATSRFAFSFSITLSHELVGCSFFFRSFLCFVCR